jgi:hypothetical protein
VEKILCEVPKEFTTVEHYQTFYDTKVSPELGPIPSWFVEIQEYIDKLKDKSKVPSVKAFRMATGIGMVQAMHFIIWYAFKYHGITLSDPRRAPEMDLR